MSQSGAAKLELGDTAYVWPDVEFDNHHWIIYIRLYKKNNNNPIKINLKWLDEPMPDDIFAAYNVLTWNDKHDTGVGGSNDTVHQSRRMLTGVGADTIIVKGHQNRNVFQQAILEVTKKYEDRLNKHFNKELIPPMLLKVMDTDMSREKFAAIDDEWYIQRKYNGVRALAKQNNNEVILYSRRLHYYNVPTIEAALKPILMKHKSIIIDGELYMPHTHLQIISGIVRGSDNEAKKKLIYVIYDFYNPDKPQLTYTERMQLLDDMLGPSSRQKIPGLIDIPAANGVLYSVPTYKIGNSKNTNKFLETLDKKYKEFLSEGYEGAVIRRASGPYEPSFHGRLSDMIFKHKPHLTSEFKCVGYMDGRGKDKGAIIWICKTKNGREFNVRPKMTDNERRKIYDELKKNPNLFDKKYKNKDLTIEYAELSIDGVPQQPRALVFRTYE